MWVKLKQAWNDHEIGTEIEVEEAVAQALITSGVAEKMAAAPTGVTPIVPATAGVASTPNVAPIVSAVAQGVAAALPEMIQRELATVLANAGVAGSDGGAGAGAAAGAAAAAGSQVTNVHDRVQDDPTGGFESYAEFAVAIYHAELPGNRQVDQRLLVQAASGMSENDDSSAGYLIPTQWLGNLLKVTNEYARVLSRARQIPMKSNMVEIPVLKDKDRTAGNRYGGIQVYWLAEAAQKTGAKPKFGKIGLKLNELAGLVYMTNTLLEDSPISLEPLIGDMFGEEFAIVIDNSMIRGTGAGQPLGILNAPCLVTQAAEAGQAAATIEAWNIIKMYARMPARNKTKAAWFINAECLPQLLTLRMPVGTGGQLMYTPPGGLSGAPYGTLFGRPVVELETCSALGTVGDIIFADFSQYLIGRRKRGIQKATSIHLRFDYDETAFRFVMRIDGQPWWETTLTPMYGTATQSPFVVLATRP